MGGASIGTARGPALHQTNGRCTSPQDFG
jgi:hypothetical protein